MKRLAIYLVLITLFIPSGKSQILLDFNLPDSTTLGSPWQGEPDKYIILNQQLRTHGSGNDAELTYLAYPYQLTETGLLRWSIDFNILFNTSSSSYARFILASDQYNFKNDNRAFYVQIGGTKDNISLYHSHKKQPIIEGRSDQLNTNNNFGQLVIERDPWGKWSLWTQINGEDSLFLEGRVSDTTALQLRALGVVASYTKTRWDKIFFDNIQLSVFPATALQLIEASVVDSQQIILDFNAHAYPAANQAFSWQIGEEKEIIENWSYGSDSSQIILFLKSNIPPKKSFTLFITNVHNKQAMVMPEKAISLLYTPALPLFVEHSKILNNRLIALYFNQEPGASAYLQEHYKISPHTDIDSIQIKDSMVLIHLQHPIAQGQTVEIEVSDITSLSGLVMQTYKQQHLWYEVQTFDIVFNEIMADPVDSVGLPEVEYVELYNRTPYPISLHQWILSRADYTTTLPETVLKPHGYLLLVKNGDAALFSDSIHCISPVTMPTLPNNEGILTLQDSSKKIIDYLHYHNSWWGETIQKDGGWSLERINSDNLNPGQENWTVSSHPLGGSPGFQNASFQNVTDNTLPYLYQLSFTDKYTLVAHFSELIHPEEKVHQPDILLNPKLEVRNFTINKNQVILHLAAPLQEKTNYTINISGFADCNQLFMEAQSLAFGLPESISPNDVVINEILFNPADGVSEYIELYNISNKVIDLSQLALARVWSENDKLPEELIPIVEDMYLLYPGQIIALTKDKASIENHYPKVGKILQVKKLPPLPNQEAYILLMKKSGQREKIDLIYYHEDMHMSLFKHVDGVALERLNPYQNALSKNNWHSASTGSSYGTPGYKNSQTFKDISSSWVEINKKSFTPDGDGNNDFLTLSLNPEETDWVVSCVIFDRYGRKQRTLANNRLIGQSDYIHWDGTNDNGTLLPVGIYLIQVQLFHPNGQRKSFQFSCVLTLSNRK